MNLKAFLSRGAWALGLSLAAAVPAAAQSETEFHGYIRSGGLLNADLKNASKDNNNGGVASTLIGRLGNEDDTWVESEFVQKITSDEGVWTKMHVNLSASSTNFALGTSVNPYLSQAYIEIGGLASDPEAVWFVGKKANREDIHILDFKWRNFDGAGAGVTGALGGTLDAALLTGDNTETGTLSAVPLTLDLRYKLPFGVQVELGAAYAKDAVKKTADATLADSGFQGALVYYWDRFYGLPGWMTLAVQGGTGMFGARASGGSNWNHLGQLGSIWTKQNSYAVRVVTAGTGTFGDLEVAGGLWAEYDNQALTGSDPYVVVAGAVRPAWKLSKNVSLTAEAGAADQLGGGTAAKVGTGLANGLSYKAAFGPTLALDAAVGARPQLRFLVSYVSQDKALGAVAADGTGTSELRFGVQAECWW